MRFSVVLALAACLAPTASRAQRISIYADQQGIDCVLAAPPPSPATFYVLAFPGGAAAGGITGAEFSIAGGPPQSPAGGWFVSFGSPAGAVSLGDPFSGGANIAFPTCQTGAPVLLFTVQAFNGSDTNDYDLRVQARVPPTNPLFNCPLVTLCDAPVFTKICVTGGLFFLNGTGSLIRPAHTPQPADGATDVAPNADLAWTWATIRSCVLLSAYQSVYFGTAPDPPLVALDYSGTTYDPGPLAPFTTYYWRIATNVSSTTVSSPVWSFRTADPVAVQPAAWSAVKQLFR